MGFSSNTLCCRLAPDRVIVRVIRNALFCTPTCNTRTERASERASESAKSANGSVVTNDVRVHKAVEHKATKGLRPCVRLVEPTLGDFFTSILETALNYSSELLFCHFLCRCAFRYVSMFSATVLSCVWLGGISLWGACTIRERALSYEL